MTLASVPDVEALLRRSLTGEEAIHAPRLLAMADATIAGELPGVSFTEVTDAAATFRLECGGDLWLPGRPVAQVTEVTVDGETVDPDLYRASRWGPLRRLRGCWPTGRDIEVTWDYGFAAAPGDVVNVAAELVRDTLGTSEGVRQESIGSYSVTYDSSTRTLNLTADHRRTLRRYRVVATSIPVESANPWWVSC